MISLLTRAMISSTTLPSVAETTGFLTGTGFLGVAAVGTSAGASSGFSRAGFGGFCVGGGGVGCWAASGRAAQQRPDKCKISHVFPHL